MLAMKLRAFDGRLSLVTRTNRLMLAVCLIGIALCSSTSAITAKYTDATDELFETPVVTELRFTVGEKEIEQIGREERPTSRQRWKSPEAASIAMCKSS